MMEAQDPKRKDSLLQFNRVKLVTIWPKGQCVLAIRGLMEDDIYSLEVLMEIGTKELEVISVEPKWIRMENSQCWRALPVVKELVGVRLSRDSELGIQKGIGRKGCRHFAEIIIECVQTLLDLVEHSTESELFAQYKKGDQRELFGKSDEDLKWPHVAELSPKGPRMVLDLHVHTYPASPCSLVSLDEAIGQARYRGLDGICLTDHNYIWSSREIKRLRERHHFLIIGASEVTTDQGDILVYYAPDLEDLIRSIKGVISLRELKDKVGDRGFLVAAHPFRGFLTFGVGMLGLSVEEGAKREVFRWVDGVEVLNTKVGDPENQFAYKVAKSLGLKRLGGSDAHTKAEVGEYGTLFFTQIKDEEDLLEALKGGNYTPVRLGER
ncbi:MAG: PHP-associated domain-containing protein [Desulfatiglandales bacterium]